MKQKYIPIGLDIGILMAPIYLKKNTKVTIIVNSAAEKIKYRKIDAVWNLSPFSYRI